MTESSDSSAESHTGSTGRRPTLNRLLTRIVTTRNFLREKFHATQAAREAEIQEKKFKEDSARIDAEFNEKMLQMWTDGADET
jgi:hypothetical protein